MTKEHIVYACKEMEYYSTLKKKEILPYATTRVSFEDVIQNNQALRIKQWNGGYQGLEGGGNGELLINQHKVSVN